MLLFSFGRLKITRMENKIKETNGITTTRKALTYKATWSSGFTILKGKIGNSCPFQMPRIARSATKKPKSIIKPMPTINAPINFKISLPNVPKNFPRWLKSCSIKRPKRWKKGFTSFWALLRFSFTLAISSSKFFLKFCKLGASPFIAILSARVTAFGITIHNNKYKKIPVPKNKNNKIVASLIQRGSTSK